MRLLYVGVPRLGGGGIIDQCGYYMSGFQDLVEVGIIDLVWLLYVGGSKTWWRGHY